MTISQLYTKLSSLPLFRGMSGNELAVVVDMVHLRWVKLGQDQTFIQQDEPCHHLAILVEGTLTRVTDCDDKTYTLTDTVKAPCAIEPEQLYGLTCKYRSRYMGQTSCQLLLISKDDVRKTLLNIPLWRINLLNHIASNLSKLAQANKPRPVSLMQRIEEFGLLTLTGADPCEPHSLRIRMQDLGDYLNASRRTISFALHALELEGKVELHPNLIIFKKSVSYAAERTNS